VPSRDGQALRGRARVRAGPVTGAAPEPFTDDALWARGEIREQAEQVPGQLDVWDALGEESGQ
jgi:hypothetical protein